MDRDERLHRALLAHLDGLGPVRFDALMLRFGSAAKAWARFGPQWLEVPGIGQGSLRRWGAIHRDLAVGDLRRTLHRLGLMLLTPGDDAYPVALRNLPARPYILFAAGEPGVLNCPAVTVVGTRRCTAYGRVMARRLAAELAGGGFVVVSGLARGIDAAAHRAALDTAGVTAAVLPCGLDRVYPLEHRHLAAEVRQRGVLLSEYPPGKPPEKGRFRARNRIMAGLGQAVVVVEAGTRSGALLTTRFALDYGITVAAVPGPVGAEASAGCNGLIRDGAHLVECAAHVAALVEGAGGVPATGAGTPRRYGVSDTAARPPAGAPFLTGDEALLYACFDAPTVTREELIRRSGWNAARVSAALLRFELRGLVRCLGSDAFTPVQGGAPLKDPPAVGEAAGAPP